MTICRRPGSREGKGVNKETGPWWAYHPGAGSGRSGRCSIAARSAARPMPSCWNSSRSGDAAEMAFEALVARHGPDVLRACRRILPDPNDADDAFQATFLVLAPGHQADRSAGRIRSAPGCTGPLSGWPQGEGCRRASATARAAGGRPARGGFRLPE